MLAVLFVAVIGKVIGCGLAALGSGMDYVRSLRVGCGMMSRGEVGLIVTAMGASTGIFGRSEVAVMVAVVLLTTLLTPVALRATFQMKSAQDIDEGLADHASNDLPIVEPQENQLADGIERSSADPPHDDRSLKAATPRGLGLLTVNRNDLATDSDSDG